MTLEEFSKFQNELFNDVHEMHLSKGTEYANDKDRFANFNRIASEIDLNRKQVLYVYLKKHLDAIGFFCKTSYVESEPIRGRIIDAINYLTLLAGMIEEEECLKTTQTNLQKTVSETPFMKETSSPSSQQDK